MLRVRRILICVHTTNKDCLLLHILPPFWLLFGSNTQQSPEMHLLLLDIMDYQLFPLIIERRILRMNNVHEHTSGRPHESKGETRGLNSVRVKANTFLAGCTDLISHLTYIAGAAVTVDNIAMTSATPYAPVYPNTSSCTFQSSQPRRTTARPQVVSR